MVRKIPYFDQKPTYSERLLEEDHTSPAGYRVPILPNFEIDPALARTGSPCVPLNVEFIFGLLMSFVIGGGITFLAFTDWDDSTIDKVQSFFP